MPRSSNTSSTSSKPLSRTTYLDGKSLLRISMAFRRTPCVGNHLEQSWSGNPVIGFMSETDLEIQQVSFQQKLVFETSIRCGFYCPTAVNNSNENITFGMDVTHLCDNTTTSKEALVSQSPTVCFKASTVLQSMGISASRILLPSSDK